MFVSRSFPIYCDFSKCEFATLERTRQCSWERFGYHPKYLYYQLASRRFRDFVELSKSGTTFFGLSQAAVAAYPVLLPPLAEQVRIATVLSDMDAEIAALESRLAKARNIKQGMMQELLSGRIRLPVDEREPKEIALARSS